MNDQPIHQVNDRFTSDDVQVTRSTYMEAGMVNMKGYVTIQNNLSAAIFVKEEVEEM